MRSIVPEGCAYQENEANPRGQRFQRSQGPIQTRLTSDLREVDWCFDGGHVWPVHPEFRVLPCHGNNNIDEGFKHTIRLQAQNPSYHLLCAYVSWAGYSQQVAPCSDYSLEALDRVFKYSYAVWLYVEALSNQSINVVSRLRALDVLCSESC